MRGVSPAFTGQLQWLLGRKSGFLVLLHSLFGVGFVRWFPAPIFRRTDRVPTVVSELEGREHSGRDAGSS